MAPIRSFAPLRCALLVAGSAVALVAAADERPLPATLELTDDTFAVWKQLIEPRPEELAWRTIPWRSNLQTGLVDAAAAGKPVLLWLMNGHPLGCT